MKNILFFGGTGKLGRYWAKNLAFKNNIYCNIHSKTNLPKFTIYNVKD